MLGRLLAAGCVAVMVAGAQVPADTGEAAPPAPIRVEVDEVVVTVTVTDEKGRFVTNLRESDFKILDEGVEQKIIYFNRERNQPVVVGFLVDISNANRIHWKVFQEAALDLINTLLPGDDERFTGYLITYGTEAELRVNTSRNPERMMESLRRVKPGGGAALFDAIYMACTSRELVKGEPLEPRRVIVVIGDGHDSASRRGLEEVLEIAQRNQVTIFGISTVAYGFDVAGSQNLDRLAAYTGGRVEYPLNSLHKGISGYISTPQEAGNYAYAVGTGAYAAELSRGVFEAIANIAGEVTTQYVLQFRPSNTDVSGAFRRLRVEVPLANVTIRHKEGYFPSRP